MSPRSIWNGAVTLGLMTVPIKVHSALEDKSIHFHEVHAKDGARIRQKRICSREGTEVPYSQVAPSYELRAGEYVMLSRREIDAAAGKRSHLIELEEFVYLREIDPVLYDRGYHLGAGRGGQAAYRLFHDALERSGRVGIGRWVFRNREYLAAIRPLDHALVLHTMRFADELVDPRSLELSTPSRAPSKREIELAGMLIDSMFGRFRPKAFKDAYRERVMALIESKAKGAEPELAEIEVPGESPDLIAALEVSLSASGIGRGQAPRSRGQASSQRKPVRSGG
ncbi:MAG: non-homologous end joining protein Ku [Solirubrobacteraceae bacterium]